MRKTGPVEPGIVKNGRLKPGLVEANSSPTSNSPTLPEDTESIPMPSFVTKRDSNSESDNDLSDNDESDNDNDEEVSKSTHAAGCSPCAYVFSAKGCRDGEDCNYCHDEEHREPRRQYRRNRTKKWHQMKRRAAQAAAADHNNSRNYHQFVQMEFRPLHYPVNEPRVLRQPPDVYPVYRQSPMMRSPNPNPNKYIISHYSPEVASEDESEFHQYGNFVPTQVRTQMRIEPRFRQYAQPPPPPPPQLQPHSEASRMAAAYEAGYHAAQQEYIKRIGFEAGYQAAQQENLKRIGY